MGAASAASFPAGALQQSKSSRLKPFPQASRSHASSGCYSSGAASLPQCTNVTGTACAPSTAANWRSRAWNFA